MAKIEIIKDYGRIEDVPMYDPEISYYTMQLVEYEGVAFYRRQKVRNGKVSSSSYSMDKVKWTSAQWQIIEKIEKERDFICHIPKRTTQKSAFDFM